MKGSVRVRNGTLYAVIVIKIILDNINRNGYQQVLKKEVIKNKHKKF